MKSIYEFDPEDARRFARENGCGKINISADEMKFQICPYCRSEKDRGTFSINTHTGQFKCLRASCGAKGNMITLAKDFGFSLGATVDEYLNSQKRFRRIHRRGYPTPTPEAIDYLENRGISKAVIERYHITSQKQHSNILVFPFYDENNILQFVKYRKTDYDKERDRNKEWCESNCKPILFGMDQIDTANKTLIMTEGQIDSLSVAEAGIDNAVSVPTGAKGFTWVPYCWDFLGGFDTLIIFGDHEHGKITLLEEMQKRFHGLVKHVREEDYKDCKDANDLLRKYGKDAIRAAIVNAVPVMNKKIIRLVDVERLNVSDMERFSTGFEKLDEKIGGFYFGQLCILTGERGLGKSTVSSQFGIFAINAGYDVFFYSGELIASMFKEWFERQAAGADSINRKYDKYRKEQYSVDGNVIKRIETWYGDHAYFYDNGIVLESDADENETLLQTLTIAAKQYGCRVFIVDNLMTAVEDDVQSDFYRQQGNFVRDLARFAKEFNVFVILVAHPKKSNGDFSNDSILGSSNITNLSDLVLRYADPKQDNNGKKNSKKSDEDETDAPRVLQIWKNRLDGTIDHKGIPLYYQDSSKRLAEDPAEFDFELGWNKDQEEFTPVKADEPTPFDDSEDPDIPEWNYEDL